MSTVTAAAQREHRVTARVARARKGGEPFSMLTAYDFAFARIFDAGRASTCCWSATRSATSVQGTTRRCRSRSTR